MNLFWEAYTLVEAAKPQSNLLEEWREKCSFSDNKETPKDLVKIFKANQLLSLQANLVKLELEYWQLVKANR